MTSAKNFSGENFNPEKFVKDFSSSCIGVEELRQQRAKIQELADSTSILLKRNVYQNYIQFIETAKEISHLESEMYQLSQLLSEQRSLLSVLGSNRSTIVEFANQIGNDKEDENSNVNDKESKQNLMHVLENVEGAASLAEEPGRIFLHEGPLLELDPLEGTPLKRIHAFLFNDILMIASWLCNDSKRGPPKYRMQIVYDLQSLAVVNIRDIGAMKLAFKLLAFPDTRVFQCVNATSKKDWLEKCDQAKKFRVTQKNRAHSINKDDSVEEKTELVSRVSSMESNIVVGYDSKSEMEIQEAFPEWISEVAEDLDSCIAQRHFEEAYHLLQKVKMFLKDRPKNFQTNQLISKVNGRIKILVTALTRELEANADVKSFQGGDLRNARRAIQLLVQLDYHAQACQLYLKLCSVLLKARLKRVKKEGPIVPYVKQLSSIAFSNIVKMAKEFRKNFADLSNYNSALILWCSQELQHFISQLMKQMFIPQVSLSSLVECIVIIRLHYEQLAFIGIDFRYQLDSQLRNHLARVLQDTGEKYVEAVKIRALEETWKPFEFTSAQSFQKLIVELDNLNITLPDYYVKNKLWIALTSNTLTFSKLYIGLLEDCLNVFTPEILNIIEEVLLSVLLVQVKHLQSSFSNPQLARERKLIQDNAKYIHDIIIARSLELYKNVTGHQFEKLLEIKDFITNGILAASKPMPAPRTSVQKYSTTEYI